VITLAQAYWNQREALAAARERLLALATAIDWPNDLLPYQWGQLYAMALEFKPDLVLELGRGYGNSTCVFTEAANRLGGCRVLSLDLSSIWNKRLGRVRRVVPEEWFAPLSAPLADILAYDYATALAGAQRVMVFWDAHGYAVAECMLGGILPLLQSRAHLVLMHDLSDARYSTGGTAYERPMYKGGNQGGAKLRLGQVVSGVEQAIAVTDFAARNGLELHSADHDLQTGLAHRAAELQALLGELFAMQAHWFYFTLNGLATPPHFPPFRPGGKSNLRVLLADTVRRLIR